MTLPGQASYELKLVLLLALGGSFISIYNMIAELGQAKAIIRGLSRLAIPQGASQSTRFHR